LLDRHRLTPTSLSVVWARDEISEPELARTPASSSSRRTPSAKNRLPPPTTLVVMNRRYSSTRPAAIAWAARLGPSMVRS
jgi:hypothetical protein